MASTRTGHAVVLGASMAGLGAARALLNHFEHVTLLERDTLPQAAATRKSVPQGAHAHGLLPRGYRILDAYFPGLMQGIVSLGAPHGDITGDFVWFHRGTWKLRANTGLYSVAVSRPCLEWQVRQHLAARPGVQILERHLALEPCFDAASRRVTGVRVRDQVNGAERVLTADLVVDATGRGSHAQQWLADWGYAAVEETQIPIDVGYATAVFERQPGDLFGAAGAIVAGTPPQSTRYAAVMGVEGERWIVTLAGCLRDYPPTELTGWREYLRSLPTTDLFEMLQGREPLAAITSHRFPTNRRRHYEKLRDFPNGYLVLGDAVCSFNPIYGQGMSVALCEAEALDACLAAGPERLAQRFFARAKPAIDTAWAIVTGEDFRYPSVVGRRPFGFGLLGRYMDLVQRAASTDREVLRVFFEVASLVSSPLRLFAPGILARLPFALLRREASAPGHKLHAGAPAALALPQSVGTR